MKNTKPKKTPTYKINHSKVEHIEKWAYCQCGGRLEYKCIRYGEDSNPNTFIHECSNCPLSYDLDAPYPVINPPTRSAICSEVCEEINIDTDDELFSLNDYQEDKDAEPPYLSEF